ncbi:MAG: DUF2470 domain-containing protein [Paracoccaceae bacterium]|tara:strand:- start:12 stop:287 length:276 start_codon:yes stop_codon:yes gene_type:complete
MVKNKPELINNEQDIIQHMNIDHSNSIVSTLNAQLGIKDPHAKMKSLDVNGYYVLSSKKTYFIKFEKSCNTTSEYKDELIKQAKKYRNFEL